MPTQLSRLLHTSAAGQADPLLGRLKRPDPEPEREIARRYNRRPIDKEQTIDVPALGQTYDDYHPRLLAILWALAGNVPALRCLGARAGLDVPSPPAYTDMLPDLLVQLWDLGRDGLALEELWRRQGLLPVTAVVAAPECVLGFLCWRHNDRAAWDELLRRYRLFDILRLADDAPDYPAAVGQMLERFRMAQVPRPCQTAREFAAVAADKLVRLIPFWDYLKYPSLEHLLVKAVHNQIRDKRRAQRRKVLTCRNPEELLQPCHKPSGTAAELEEVLSARLPFEERVVRKAQNGIDLTDDELAWAANRNLTCRGLAVPSADQLEAEKTAIALWLAENRAPTGAQLSKCFLWYKASQFSKASRLARLRLLIDDTERALEELPLDVDVQELAKQVVAAMEDLVGRVASGHRSAKRQPAQGPVVCFGALEDAGRRLPYRLGASPLDRQEADALARCQAALVQFAEHFPVLVKLSACRRLACWLLKQPGTATNELIDLARWLEEGQQWLSSFHVEDKKRAGDFAAVLAPLLQQLVGRPLAGLRLLRLWLEAARVAGPADPRLVALDGVWWGYDEAGAADDADRLVELAAEEKWLAVGEEAGRMLDRLGEAPQAAWSADAELRAHLKQLRGRRRSTPAQRDACRRLLGYLREHGPAETMALLERWAARLEALDGSAADEALHAEIKEHAASLDGTAAAGRAALRLLVLWLAPADESNFSVRVLKDLDLLWSLTHDPWYTWPAEVPELVEELIAVVADGDWSKLAEAAMRALDRFPDVSTTSRAVARDFHDCLQRLSRRRGPRGRRAARPPLP